MSMFYLYRRFLRIHYQNHVSGFLNIIQIELTGCVQFIMFANAPIVETKFLELAMSLLDFFTSNTPWYFLDFA